jgi:hypothetical protein
MRPEHLNSQKEKKKKKSNNNLACAKSLQKLGITHPIAAPPKLYVKYSISC